MALAHRVRTNGGCRFRLNRPQAPPGRGPAKGPRPSLCRATVCQTSDSKTSRAARQREQNEKRRGVGTHAAADTIAASAGAAAGCELGTAPSAARRTMRTETRSENGKTAASTVTADAVRARTVTASTVTADAVTARTVTASTVTASTFGGLDLPCRNEPDLFFAE